MNVFCVFCFVCCANTASQPDSARRERELRDAELARRLEEEERKREEEEEEEDKRLAEELWRREQEQERERKNQKEIEETLTMVRLQAKTESDEELGEHHTPPFSNQPLFHLMAMQR